MEEPVFIDQLEQQLQRFSGGLSEHQLIQALQAAGCFNGWVSADPTLALFQKHFAVMHHLYHLQPQYKAQGQELFISPVRIQLFSSPDSRPVGGQLTTSIDTVKEFYLDWSNFTAATPDTVAELLRGFWRRYAAVDKTAAALQELELEPGTDWNQVQVQYRRLAAQHHPDKGGDSEKFAQVREAYEILRRIRGNNAH